MKLLWVKTDFLHPTTRGGQIRTLELLRCLHRKHEIHYVAFDDPNAPEGLERASEYSSKVYPIDSKVVDKESPAFLIELIVGLFSRIPVAVQRYRSAHMRDQVERLLQQEHFDCIVCDFLFPAPNLSNLSSCILFQHNVEAVIWQRRTEHASDPLRRLYLSSRLDVCFATRAMFAVRCAK